MESTIEKTSTYNYPNFKAKFYQFKNFEGLKKGDKFIDFALMTADGEKVKISDFLNKPLVLEMGSVTCPMYGGHVTPMQKIASEYSAFNFLVLYVREAHPGNNIACHQNYEDKVAAAREAAQFYNDRRTTLVDTVDGEAHRVYGALPNSIYVISTDGIVQYVNPWNNTDYLRPILDNILKEQPTEHLKFRPATPGLVQSFKTLFKGGWVSFWDFVKQSPMLLWKHWKAGNLF